MARLPQPGGDNGDWGSILNDFLNQALKSDGKIKDNAITANTIAPNSITNAAIATNAVNATSIADGSVTNALLADATIQEAKLSSAVQIKLNANGGTPDWSTITNKPAVIGAGATQAAAKAALGLVKADVGLGNVDNTSDTSKPVSTATQAALDSKLANPTGTPNGSKYLRDDNSWQAIPTTADATTSSKGIVQLSGDLGGTAASPSVVRLSGVSISGTPSTGNVLTATSTTTANWTSVPGAPVSSVAGKTGDVTLVVADIIDATVTGQALVTAVDAIAAKTSLSLIKTDVGLGNVDNTSDTNKPVSTATATALGAKTDKSTLTNKGDIYAATAASIITRVGVGSDGYVLTADSSQATGLVWATPAAGADATTSTKGIVQLSGDLGGSASAPTVPGLAGKEPTITAGTNSQYYRGDKTFQTLDKTAVGLGNVDNTSDANKPVSTAAQTALDTKAVNSAVVHNTGTEIVAGTKTFSDAPKLTTNSTTGDVWTASGTDGSGGWAAVPGAPVSSVAGKTGDVTLVAADITNATTTGRSLLTSADVAAAKSSLSLVRGDVGLSNVDNTSDAVKNSAAATLTNKTLTAPTIDSLRDSNGNITIDLIGIASAVNHYYTTNQSLGNYPTLGVDGSDTDIGMSLAPKGSGPVRIFAGSGITPTIDTAGPDTNLDINFVPKGAGRVKANGVNILTASSTDTLTNKTLVLPSAASPSYTQGKLVYDTDNESLTFFNNDSNISLQVGQEEWIRVLNTSGSSIGNGAPVYLSGASGGYPTVALAKADSSATVIGAGLATETIANGTTGMVTTIGAVRGIDTSVFSAGQTVYISATTAGTLTGTAPAAPNYRYRIGIVGISSTTLGTIHVTPSTAALGNGSANQLFGINNAGTAQEVKSIAGTTNNISVTHSANTITLDLGSNVPTNTGVQTLTNKTLTTPVLNGTPTGTGVASISTANTLALRDGNANLTADAFIPSITSTASAAGTTTLTSDSTQIQIFTGTNTQTITMPTTGIAAGQSFTIINQSTGILTVNSSSGSLLGYVYSGMTAAAMANQATPTANTHWVINVVSAGAARLFGTDGSGGPAQMLYSATGSQTFSIPLRDTNANLAANNFIPGTTSTATVASTTTLTVSSAQIQIFTGTTTQTVLLPTTSIGVGQTYTIINQSTGNVTVQSSGANTITTMTGSRIGVFTANVATPTTAAHWSANTLTTGTNMTFPTTSATIARTDAAQTFTGTQTFSSAPSFSALPGGSGVASAASASTLAARDANANLLANNFIKGFATTATAASTTTLVISSKQIQVFTGTSTQTVALPTSSVVAGVQYTIVNQSTSNVTVQSSGANTIATLGSGTNAIFTALVATPTTAANWYTTPAGAGDMLKSTYDPANIVQQIVGTTATQTVTNKTLTAPIINTGINAQTGTTYTLVLADGGQLVTLSNTAAITLTVPLNSSVAYAIGTRIKLAQLGVGQVTVAATGGVTINSTPGLKLSAQYSGATLTKLATDTWLLVGSLSS